MMKTIRQWRQSRYGLALAVLLLGAGLTFGVWTTVHSQEQKALLSRFESRSDSMRELFESRFAQYQEVLRGLQGLFSSSIEVERHEWDAYVESLHLSEHFPGVAGVSYVKHVRADELSGHTARIRSEGVADYRVLPEGRRADYYPMVYASLHSAVSRLGFDVLTDPARHAALDRARDTGQISLSGRLSLLRDSGPNPPAASVMYLPIYRRGAPVRTVAERQRAIDGLVALSFRYQDLVRGILGTAYPDLRLQILDLADDAGLYGSSAIVATGTLQRTMDLDISGRRWRMQVNAQPAFYAAGSSKTPWVLAGGLVISLLLAGLVLALRRSEARAQVVAAERNAQLRESEERMRLMVDNVGDYGIFMLDPEGAVATWNRGARRISGYPPEDIIGRHFSCFYPPEDIAAGKPGRELQSAVEHGRFEDEGWRLRKDGQRYWANVVLTALRDPAGALLGFTNITRDLTERKRAEDLVQHVAHHDALTDLPNRHLLLDRLHMAIKQARRVHRSIGVLMVDLDHFKRINDSLGHACGDQVLLKIAERMNAVVRTTDTVARIGGDEFVLLLPEITEREDVRKVAANLIERLSQPIHVSGHNLHVTPSIGLCLYPNDGDDAGALLKNADTAMYHAKSAGRNNYQWFDRQMLKLAEHKLEMEGELRHALERGEFRLHYQPQVSLTQRRIVGMEALVRWQHPRHGLLMPDKFIPLAEETGLILPIGAWVLQQACIETQRMRQQTGQDLNIAVNVSTVQFQQADFLRMVEDALAGSGLPPQALTLEITESVLAQDPNDAIRLLNEIRELGVSVAVDDFGIGYSSLSYVTRFPIAKLKIDRSFVSEISQGSSGDAVTSTIITMAHSLNLKVVAEGVESQEQLRFLDARACDEGQGFLFGRPLDQADFLKLAQASTRTH